LKEEDIYAYLRKNPTDSGKFRIFKIEDRKWDVTSPKYAFLKDFVTNSYMNAENEADYEKIRLAGQTAGGLANYGVWRTAVAQKGVSGAELNVTDAALALKKA